MHIIVCSNNETNFMQIDEGENRYAVLKVGVLEKDDPFIMSRNGERDRGFSLLPFGRGVSLRMRGSREWDSSRKYIYDGKFDPSTGTHGKQSR